VERGRWDLGLTTCDVDPAYGQELQRFLGTQLGFSGIREITQAPARQDWISPVNVVFYYADDTKPAARALARSLSQKTGLGFAVSKGAGLGLIDEQRDVTLFVHLLGPGCL
jgi:hypothetical protein